LLLLLNSSNHPPSQVDPWLWLNYGVMLVWTMFVLPLFIALETGLLSGIEHGAGGWKQLFSLPVRRGALYSAKIIMAVGLVGAAHLMLCFWTVIAGEITAMARPELQIPPIPSVSLPVLAVASFAGSLLMLAIHAWISLRWSSLVLNMGIAIMAMLVNLSLVDSDLRRFYPWFLPADLTNRIFQRSLERAELGIPAAALPSLSTSLLGGAVVMLAAILLLKRRDVY
jgi:hypothetical protein